MTIHKTDTPIFIGWIPAYQILGAISVICFEPYPHESYIDLAHFQALMFTSHNQECLDRKLNYVALSDVADWIDEK